MYVVYIYYCIAAKDQAMKTPSKKRNHSFLLRTPFLNKVTIKGGYGLNTHYLQNKYYLNYWFLNIYHFITYL